MTVAAGSGIVNSGIITGTGGTAIDVSGATSAVTIDQNAGTITGAIKLSSNADILNITGGTINGNIIGSGSSNTINFAPGGTLTYASPYGFGNINQVNINSGTVVLNGVDGATNLAVNSGATLAGTGTITASLSVNSGGTLQPGVPGSVGTLNVTGNVSFASTADYLDTISGSNAAKTTITGNVTLGDATVTVAPGSVVNAGTRYTIVADTDAGIGGTNTFNPTVMYHGMVGTISYDADDVYLTFSLSMTCYTGPYPSVNPVGSTIPCILVQSTSFTGNVVNNGTISPSGISVTQSITNIGTISAGKTGIYVAAVSTFSGNISNAGSITGKTGIVIGSGASPPVVQSRTAAISRARAGRPLM